MTIPKTDQSVVQEQQDVAGLPHVFTAVAEVMAAIGKTGIGKDRKNQQQSYSFRGIDDIYNDLSPLFVAAKLLVFPNVLERVQEVRETKSGGTLQYTTVKVEYTLRSAVDGSWQKVTTYGEAMDSADKSTNKAMSAALKYALIQVLLIPTEGDNDADAKTPDVAPRAVKTDRASGDTANKADAPKTGTPVPTPAADMILLKALKADIAKLGKNAGRMEKMVLKAYSVKTLDAIPEKFIPEAIGRVASFLKAQADKDAKPAAGGTASPATGAAIGGAAVGGSASDLPE